MMLIYNVKIVNEGIISLGAVLIKGEFIDRVLSAQEAAIFMKTYKGERLDGEQALLIPGVIDDQVHFRQPGLTYKADIHSESRAAAAGGITSFMEMPNTNPQTLTQELLEEKYAIGAEHAVVNYSFYMGASNDNLKEVARTDPEWVCGTKVFMGASTGNMLVDNPETLRGIFAEAPGLVAVHSEDESIIQANMKKYKDVADSAVYHPKIRSAEACIRSTEKAMELATKYQTRLHILHISTGAETRMFDAGDVSLKKITAEACVHHLWFTDEDYKTKGNWIKWNPAVKSRDDRDEIRRAVLENRIDVVATDHAPHTIEEKQREFLHAPSGGPLVQHSLPAMLEMSARGIFPLECVVDKMCHDPARLFKIHKRGFIREGYYADLVLVKQDAPWKVEKSNILYKCGWSPFEGQVFNNAVAKTWVNGKLVYDEGNFDEDIRGMRLRFA